MRSPGVLKNPPLQADSEFMGMVDASYSGVRAPRENARAVLEASAEGKWVLIHGSDEVGIFDSFEDAAAAAVEAFGVGSYLIRTGTSTVTLPASVAFPQA